MSCMWVNTSQITRFIYLFFILFFFSYFLETMSLFPLNSVQNFRPVSVLVFDTYRGFKMECGPYFPVTTGSTEKVKSLL